ncbi:hypothetical protein MAP00_004032 [Monascus purpureus]|nr:hypothetical protein MAP00_004032 [Monascus purpureus]
MILVTQPRHPNNPRAKRNRVDIRQSVYLLPGKLVGTRYHYLINVGMSNLPCRNQLAVGGLEVLLLFLGGVSQYDNARGSLPSMDNTVHSGY